VLWAEKLGTRLKHIQPGNPQQNAYVERYNRTVRYDWLGHYLSSPSLRYKNTSRDGSGHTITNDQIWPWEASPPNRS
jgi:transposase InsO family protein